MDEQRTQIQRVNCRALTFGKPALTLARALSIPVEGDFRDDIDDRYRAEKFQELLMTLSDRERKVLIARYWDNLTFKDIGTEYSVSPGRVQQIHAKVIRKLKHPTRAEKLIEIFQPHALEEYRAERKREEEREKREAEQWRKECAELNRIANEKRRKAQEERERKRKEWYDSFWKQPLHKGKEPTPHMEQRHRFGGTDDIPPLFCKLGHEPDGTPCIVVPLPYSIRQKDDQYYRWLNYLLEQENEKNVHNQKA